MVCPHGMPSPASCVTCMEDGPVAEPVAWRRVGGSFRSAFLGNCPSCGCDIFLDVPIQRWDLGSPATLTAYTHARCSSPPR